MASKFPLLLKSAQTFVQSSRNINCWIAAITKTHRETYVNTYLTKLQYPDGSTIEIQYHCPIGAIRLPVDLSKLSDAEKKQRLLRRVPKTKVKIQEDIEDDYDATRYLKYTKKK